MLYLCNIKKGVNMTDGIWDDGEWISWDEINDQLDEMESRESYSSSEKHITPQINTKKNNNKSRRNNSNTKKKKTNTTANATNMRKPHMALHYKSARLNKHIESYIEGITPSKIPQDISSLFLEKIWDTMNKNIKKDIEELFEVYFIHQWTATSLMAGRLLENVLKIHIAHDLKEETVTNIGNAIKKLEEHNYDPSLLKKLNTYKEQRNNFMHGIKRAGAGEAKNFVVDVISITMSIHNIKP
jgi:hypothetical protein